MSYAPMPDQSYEQSVGPYGTPGWQFAPVPGWGVNPDFSARDARVGIGGTTMNDQVLPRYSPLRANIPSGDAFEHLELQGREVPSNVILPRGMQLHLAAKYPQPPYLPVQQAPIMPIYKSRAWKLTQGGYYPVGVDPTPVPASASTQYGLGTVLLAGAGALLTGMALTYFWMEKG